MASDLTAGSNLLTLRHLSSGAAVEGEAAGWEGPMLQVELSAEGSRSEWAISSLVEIECGSMRYLGEIWQRQGQRLTVLVEHALDGRKLDWMQNYWPAPPGGVS